MSFENKLYVITGGPGAGKTTLLNALASQGCITVPEVAREIIKSQMHIAGEGLPWKDKKLYTALMLEKSVASYSETLKINIHYPVFFDRGILDSLCYSQMIGEGISEKMDAYARAYLYHKKVFMLPPWMEIYQTDEERKQTWEEAVFTYDAMKSVYEHYGYDVIKVPKDTVENRRNFVLNEIK